MSKTPYPGAILDLVAALDQDAQSPQLFTPALTRALHGLQEVLPSTTSVRVYGPALDLLASTAETQNAAIPENILQGSAPVHEAGAWFVPMRAGGQAQGLLAVETHAVDAQAWLLLVAACLAQAVARQQMTRQLGEIEQLYDLTRSILAAQDVLEVLRAVRTLATDASRISHSTLVYDDAGQIADIVVDHILTPDQEQVVHRSMAEFEDADSMAVDVEFWQHPPAANVFVDDTANPPHDFPTAMAQAAQSFGVGSYVLMPIFRGDRVREIVRVAFSTSRPFESRARQLYDAARDQITVVLQSLRLVQETRRNTARLMEQVAILQSLSDLSTVIGIAQDEQQLLHQSAQALVGAINVDYCWVATLDSSRERGTVFCEYPNRDQTGQPFALADLPVTTRPNADNPMPVVVNDVSADSRVSTSARDQLVADGVTAFMLMPLFVRGSLAGLIRLDIRDAARSFTPEMQEVAQTILAQVIVGLQNIRLLEETQHRSEQLQRINHFGQTLQSTLDLPIILDAAIQESRQMLPVERMSIALYDYESERLRTSALYANEETYVTPTNGAEVEMEGSVVGRAWHSRAMVHIPDMNREVGGASVEMPELRSLLVLPLVTRAGVMGVVSVGHSQPYAYSETDIIVFQQMMAQFAAAIENATLYERTQRIARREALMNEISGRLQGTGSVESALTEAARSLQQVLGSGRVAIRLGAPPAANGKDGDA